MTIEQRLYHAARELREVRIDVPPLGTRPTTMARRSRVPVLVAPMLFAIGGLVTIGVVQGRAADDIQTDIPSSASAPTAPTAPTAPRAVVIDAAPIIAPAPSVRVELQMIAEIVNSNSQPANAAVLDTDPTATLLVIAGPS